METLKNRSPPIQSGMQKSHRINETTSIGEIIQLIINEKLKSKIMKTAQLNGSAVNGKSNNSFNGKSDVKNLQPMGNGLVANKIEAKCEEPKKLDASPMAKPTEQTKETVTAPKLENARTDLKGQLTEEKPALNLEKTIKLALDLNRRINQRGKLLETIETLEAFEVAQKDDAEETDSNYFQGCKLTIEDDKGREFTTKNPFIIREVASKVNTLCVDKLAEIEGEIFIPINN